MHHIARSTSNRTSKKTADPSSGPSSGSTSSEQFHESLNKLRVLTKFNQELGNNVTHVSQEMHEERMKKLRSLASKLKEDSWKYTPPTPSVDKLLSL